MWRRMRSDRGFWWVGLLGHEDGEGEEEEEGEEEISDTGEGKVEVAVVGFFEKLGQRC